MHLAIVKDYDETWTAFERDYPDSQWCGVSWYKGFDEDRPEEFEYIQVE